MVLASGPLFALASNAAHMYMQHMIAVLYRSYLPCIPPPPPPPPHDSGMLVFDINAALIAINSRKLSLSLE